MSNIPEPGESITTVIVTEIVKLFKYRQRTFVGESEDTSLSVVLFNIGDSFTPVYCVKGEWTGLKRDIRDVKGRASSLPACPNGHVMLEGRGLKLGWVEGD